MTLSWGVLRLQLERSIFSIVTMAELMRSALMLPREIPASTRCLSRDLLVNPIWDKKDDMWLSGMLVLDMSRYCKFVADSCKNSGITSLKLFP